MYVDIGCNGQISGGGVFDNCTLSKLLSSSNNELNILDPKPLPGRSMPIPYYITAVDDFPLK